LELADLIDLEVQLARDHDVPREQRQARDRRLGLTLGADDRPRDAVGQRALLVDWVRAVREESLGSRIVGIYQTLGALLVLLGLSSGAGTAAAVLAYDGTRPVNVVHFLAVFVGLQLVLLALFLLSAPLWRLRGRVPFVQGIYGALRWLASALAGLAERRLSAERRAQLKAARGRLAASHQVYGTAERWLLVSLGQRFGLSFNLGALATCLYLVAFSDLAFAWQTTLDWSAEGFHHALTLLATPWSWLYPEGLPSLDVVRASRYFRLDGSFGQVGPTAPLLGQWWRFLVLCLTVYGLLPRLALSIFSAVRLRRALAGLRLDHAEVASLLERLTSPVVHTQATSAEAAPGQPRSASRSPLPIPAGGGVASVVVWGEVPIAPAELQTLVARRFGWEVQGQAQAGVDDTQADRAVIDGVAAGGSAPIVVLAEAFEAPTREARRFLADLRAAVGAERPIVVALLDGHGPPAPDDERIWVKHVAGLGDPYLRVEALVE
jgi:Protein of unknown function (DUF2868)